MKDKEQAKKLYDHNREWIESNRNSMNWKQLAAFCKKQDALYNIFNNIEGMK